MATGSIALQKTETATGKTPTPRKTRYGVRNHPPLPGCEKYTLPYCLSLLTDNPTGVTNLLATVLAPIQRTDIEKSEIADTLKVNSGENERNIIHIGRTRAKSGSM